MTPPDLFDRLYARFLASLTAPIGDQRRAMAVTLAVLAGIGALLAVVPWLYIDDMFLDLFIPLDGAWRMINGQRPHLDFYTPIGDVYYLILGLVGRLSGFTPKLVIEANLVVAALVAAAAMVLSQARLPLPLRIIAVAFLVLMAMSPRTLDFSNHVSHVASYNRHGWSLASLALLGIILEPERRSRRQELLELAVLTVVLVALFFLKPTYWALAGAGLLMVAVTGGANRRLAFLTGVLSLLVVGLVLAVSEQAAAYLGDLARVAKAQSAVGGRFVRLPAVIESNRLWLVVAVGLALVPLRSARTIPERKEAGRVGLVILVLLAVLLGVTAQNHDYAMPAIAVLCLGPVANLRRQGGRPGLGLSAVLAMAVAGLPAWWDVSTILTHTVMPLTGDVKPMMPPSSRFGGVLGPGSKAFPDTILAQLAERGVPDLYMRMAAPTWNNDAPLLLENGLALLARLAPPGAKVASLTFAPMFPVLMGAPPPKHLASWLDWNRTVGDQAPLTAETFSDSDVVMVSPAMPVPSLWPQVKPVIEAGFALAADTPLWQVWVRK